MLEMYYKYRLEYKNYIIFIRSGNFYEVFDKDSLILNKIFGYKVKKFKSNLKVGFPINRLDYIISLLNNVNYIIVDKEIIKKEKFSNNRYIEFDLDANKVLINSIRIDRIYNYLNDRLLDNNINLVLDNMEKIL